MATVIVDILIMDAMNVYYHQTIQVVILIVLMLMAVYLILIPALNV